MKQYQPYLMLALRTIKRIRDNTPKTRDEFLASPNAQDATAMRLQEIGENLAKVRDKFPEVYARYATDDWHKAIGLRNIISHGYQEVDFEAVWNILEAHIDDLATSIENVK